MNIMSTIISQILVWTTFSILLIMFWGVLHVYGLGSEKPALVRSVAPAERLQEHIRVAEETGSQNIMRSVGKHPGGR